MHKKEPEFSVGEDSAQEIQQAGAICFKRNSGGHIEVLLVGSLRSGRLGIPKGHIFPGEAQSVAALRGAFEEVGVEGTVEAEPFGTYVYSKDANPYRYRVTVFLLEVSRVAEAYPEAGTRNRGWYALSSAIAEVTQPKLRALLEQF